MLLSAASDVFSPELVGIYVSKLLAARWRTAVRATQGFDRTGVGGAVAFGVEPSVCGLGGGLCL